MKTRKGWMAQRAAFLLACLLLLVIPVPAARAEPADNFCNLIVVTRFADDSADAYNLTYNTGWSTVSNWSELKGMFGSVVTDHSTKAFIYTASQGRVVLNNFFPQDKGDGTAATFTLAYGQSHYSDGYEIAHEVVAAINAGTIPLDSTVKLDNRSAGILDNLTVIVQGDSEEDSSSIIYPHHTYYEGSDKLKSQYSVGDYNVIDSESLIPTVYSASDGLRGRQGTISHELLHSFGFPDLYRYGAGDQGDPVGTWDIMAHTTYQWQNLPLTYDRQAAGFIPAMAAITAAGTYTLDAASSSGGSVGFILKSPLSSSEFFVAEYRVKGNSYNSEFDSKIPGTGLILYRVDTHYDTNKAGDNYLYVFRQNPTSIGGAAEGTGSSQVQYALLVPDAATGLTSYGSTDLSAQYTQNTLYYSDGSNSGIEISNVKQDGQQITFDVSLADYSSADLWSSAGGALAASALENPSLLNINSELYLAGTKTLTEGSSTVVQRSGGSAWTQIGQEIGGLSGAVLGKTADGTVLLTGCQNSGMQTTYRYNSASGTWEQIWQSAQYCSGTACFASSGTDTYLCFDTTDGSGQKVQIVDALTGTSVLSDMGASSALYSPPCLCCYNGQWYLLVLTYLSGASRQPTVYLLRNAAWTPVYTFGAADANATDLCVCGGKLYALASGNQKEPVLACFDGTAWTEESLQQSIAASMADLRLLETNTEPVIAAISGAQNTISVWQRNGEAWDKLGANIVTSGQNLDAVIVGNTVYVAAATQTQLTVSQHTLAAAEPVTPQPGQTDDFSVTVTPPAGYTDTQLFVDGVEYTAAASGGNLKVTLADGNAKTAILYRYSGGVPVGMVVCLLSYANGKYAAVWQPELEDLLTYHGFSVRVAGVSGIRFKTGIQQSTKQQLIAGTLAGWRLEEYGTIVMRDTNRASYPFVLDGTYVSKRGRAYWNDGTIHDQVFESVGGRDRFTSVLVKLPAKEYKTNFAFRGYILLEKDGATYTLYGPIVARSIYTVAGQLLARQEFSAGSSADQFLRKLRSDADALG